MLAYGFGDLSFSLSSTIMGAYFALYLTDVAGLRPALAAVAILIGRTWDYINDPILGWLSDRTRSRWGRRIPYLVLGTPLLAFCFFLLWRPAPVSGDIAMTAWYAFLYFIYDTAFTIVFMPYAALTPEIAPSYDDRTRITGYRMAFSIIGSLVAFTLPLALSGPFTPDNRAGPERMGLIFALVLIPPLYAAAFSVKENPAAAGKAPGIRSSLRAVFRNKALLWGLALFLFTWVAIDILQVLVVYYIKYVLKMEGSADILMAAIFVTALVSLPLWNAVSKRTDKKRTAAIGYSFLAVILVAMAFAGPETPLPLIMALCVLAGVGVGAAHVVPWAVIPDAMELDELSTGERHEGVFYSIVLLAQKTASSLAVPGILLVMDIAGYVPNAASQSPGALTALRLAFSLGPAALLGLGILAASRYPLNREKHAALVAALEERRRAEGRAE